jgi:hypothetical protein
MNNNYIFVQIASYRDPELLPTIRDCLQKAKNPDLLHFGICNQYSNDDSFDNELLEFKDNPNFTIMNVLWNDSKGACWARHHVQKMWKGEQYTLQLDSHHRFIENWDEELKLMMVLTGVDKPIITAYAGSYNPTEEKLVDHPPWQMDAKFTGDIILFTPSLIENHESLTKPIPSRFISGHFYFTYGVHCVDCQYDPELYFTGEEIYLSVCSYTRGYDLFHPHKNIIWHEYTRLNRVKHWDDFNAKNTKILTSWDKLDSYSKQRVRYLLGQTNNKIDLGIYTLGTVRSLKDYETYAGINFKHNKLHPLTIKKVPPPINDNSFIENVTIYKIKLMIPHTDMTNIQFISIVIDDEKNNQLFRQDLVNYTNSINITLETNAKPYKWIYWCLTKENKWINKIENYMNPIYDIIN